jgi:hypothetical protein
LAIATPVPPTDAVAYLATVGAVTAVALVGVGLGLVIGAVLRPLPAAVIAAALSALLLAGSHLGLPPGWQPLALLAALGDAERPLTTGVRGTGIGLGMAAATTVLARWALSRAEL